MDLIFIFTRCHIVLHLQHFYSRKRLVSDAHTGIGWPIRESLRARAEKKWEEVQSLAVKGFMFWLMLDCFAFGFFLYYSTNSFSFSLCSCHLLYYEFIFTFNCHFCSRLNGFYFVEPCFEQKKNNNQGNQWCILHLEVFNDLLLDVPILGYIISN